MPRDNRMTVQEFDRLLYEVIDRDNPTASDLLAVAGIYEILSEHYNNDVLRAWDDEHTDDDDEDTHRCPICGCDLHAGQCPEGHPQPVPDEEA